MNLNLSKLPINKLFNLMLSNRRILSKGVSMTEKSIRSAMGAATCMKIANGSENILFTDGTNHWKTPQDQVWGASGKLIRGFIEPLILKMANGSGGRQVSLLLDNSGPQLIMTALLGTDVLIDGTIIEVFEKFKQDFAGVDIGSEVSGLLGEGGAAPLFSEDEIEAIDSDAAEYVDFEEVEQ